MITYFSIENRRCKVYLRFIQLHETKIWGVEIWLIVNTYFFILIFSLIIYLKPGKLYWDEVVKKFLKKPEKIIIIKNKKLYLKSTKYKYLVMLNSLFIF